MHNKKELSLVQVLDKNRALAMLIIAVLFFWLHPGARNFMTVYNVTTILKGASLSGICAVGFTLIFILGQLDLSIGSVLIALRDADYRSTAAARMDTEHYCRCTLGVWRWVL